MAATLVVVLAGCTQAQLQGWLPGNADTTNETGDIMALWFTSWVILLVVGLVTWILIIWAAVMYRRRKGQTGLPIQLRYNLPIEIFYTVVPLILVLGFFAFTARTQNVLEARFDEPEVKIEAYGKRWAWDFNYLGGQTEDGQVVEGDAYTAGVQAVDAARGPQGSVNEELLPTLYLPVDTKVEIHLKARDVIHSFWVVDFLYKKDMIPGVDTNYFTFIPQEEGTFIGKCAELCGEYHSLMLFQVKVVSLDEYNSQVRQLKDAGFEGRLGDEYNANSTLPGTGAPEMLEHGEENTPGEENNEE
ncbi:cytochrome c oxidase subunit II [Microbacteriaceae bacterium 4G12]|jgi:cytochrome c oxidase subunit 2|nr:cytochrome c oxidase subunit II [Planctomonas deserti]